MGLAVRAGGGDIRGILLLGLFFAVAGLGTGILAGMFRSRQQFPWLAIFLMLGIGILGCAMVILVVLAKRNLSYRAAPDALELVTLRGRKERVPYSFIAAIAAHPGRGPSLGTVTAASGPHMARAVLVAAGPVGDAVATVAGAAMHPLGDFQGEARTVYPIEVRLRMLGHTRERRLRMQWVSPADAAGFLADLQDHTGRLIELRRKKWRWI